MKLALGDTPPIPFRIPPGIKLVRVNAHTGLRAAPGDTTAIVEAFKPDEEPDDAYSVIGFSDPASAEGYADDTAAQTEDGWAPRPSGPPGFGSGRGGVW
jgi:penicillin-binding protein 1A